MNEISELSCCADAYFDKSPIDAISSLSDLITSDMVVCKDAKFGHVTTTTTTTTTTTNIGGLMLSQIKLESLANPAFNLLSSTTSHPLLEESQYYSDLSQIFNTGRVDCEPFDHLDTKLFADDGGFCEMDFDMETETLAWINVAEVWVWKAGEENTTPNHHTKPKKTHKHQEMKKSSNTLHSMPSLFP